MRCQAGTLVGQRAERVAIDQVGAPVELPRVDGHLDNGPVGPGRVEPGEQSVWEALHGGVQSKDCS